MNREVCGKLIHECVSGVLFTTEEFSLKDSLALYDLLVKEGFILERGEVNVKRDEM